MDAGVSQLTRLTRSRLRTGRPTLATRSCCAHPRPVHRQPGRDRRAHPADVRPPRDPGRDTGHRRPGCARPPRCRRPSSRAAVASGADAIHPGFGFLAESADFAQRRRGRAPLGRARRPRRSGRWATRRQPVGWRHRSAFRCSPATTTPTSRTRRSSAAATRIGFPLLVKPAAGGGGKGMRIVREPSRLGDALAAARREATAAFGDDRLILERLVEGAAPRRGPGPLRCRRSRRPPRRARLLDPAPAPEGPRGDAVAGGRARAPRRAWRRPR